MIYYVSKMGSDKNDGSEHSPFLTVQRAADIAMAGDTVIVTEGVYRERISPNHSGLSEVSRITYKAMDGHRVVIKGSEIIESFEPCGDIFRAKIDNRLFGQYNPFATEIKGDWIEVKREDAYLHTAAVYIDGRPLRENVSMAEVHKTEMSWYAEVEDEYTVVFANFGELDPSKFTVEVNVRDCCFAPNRAGVNYITVSGFEMAHAATNWAPPTGEQNGAIWARWCKGWIIENNTVHHSRCTGISLGRESDFENNPMLILRRKTGFRNQLETLFKSVNMGWSKERVGSHLVRNNTVYSCGQAGIVGHMGCAFSEVCQNHIYDIGYGGFEGAEIAGIKFHAAIDTYIHHNCIHGTKRGLWLDWEAQGVRVSSNVLYDNNDTQDFYIEVTHGPLLIDNNIFASRLSVSNFAQGSAFIGNCFGGKFNIEKVLYRYTPYHFPHSTDVMGCSMVYGGDDRIYNNVFAVTGTDCYNGMPASYDEYNAFINDSKYTTPNFYGFTDHGQPVFIGNNVYSGEAVPFEKEADCTVYKTGVGLEITEESDGVYAELKLPADCPCFAAVNTHSLPAVRMSEGLFETPDGKTITLDTDISGNKRENATVPGPFAKANVKVKVFDFAESRNA